MKGKGRSGPVDAKFLELALASVEARRAGHIAISDGVREIVCVFTRRGVRLVAVEHPVCSLADWLIADGRLAPGRVEVRDCSSREALVRAGVSPEDIDAAVRGVVILALADTALWPAPAGLAGAGDLALAPPPPGAVVFEEEARLVDLVPVAQASLGVRLPDGHTAETLRLVTTGDTTARRYIRDHPDVPASRLLTAILERPGTRGAEAMAALGWGETWLARALSTLDEAGLVAIEGADAGAAQKDAARARAGEETLSHAVVEVARRLGIARAWASARERARAAHHEARAGWLLNRSGRAKEAAECFERALGLAPETLEAKAGHVFLGWQRERADETAVRELARLFLEAGLPRQAQTWLALLLSSGEDVASLQLLRAALAQGGDSEGSREVAARVVELLEASGQHAEALKERAHTQIAGASAGASALMVGDERNARRATLWALALTPLLGITAMFVHADLKDREAFAQATEAAKTRLARGDAVQDVRALFPEASGGAARQMRERLAPYLADEELAQSVRSAVRYYRARNIDALIERLEAAEESAQTESLRQPVDRLLRELRARRQRAVQEAESVQALGNRPQEAFARARALLERYPDCPRVLARVTTPVLVDSKPTGALVRWRGVDLGGRRTPLTITLPLAGTREIQLNLKGYMPLKTELELGQLDAPHVVLKLGPSDPKEFR